MTKPPIDVIELFPALGNKLITLLKSLSKEDWLKQTVAKKWKVKDVVAHLADGNYRQIAVRKHGWTVEPDMDIRSYEDLVNYLNGFNADWVKAAKRLSPEILIDMLEDTNDKVYRLYKSLDPFAPSVYPVSWAGENESQNWFDIAREYTERWLHQQQIREALGDKTIMVKELYHPVLDIFMYAWPVACKDIAADEGTVLKTTITGEGGGDWHLEVKNGKWKMGSTKENHKIIAETIIDGKVAWKLFSKSVRKEDIKDKFEIKGNAELGEKVLDMVSVMA